jgi:PAS domain S-box-containing protein
MKPNLKNKNAQLEALFDYATIGIVVTDHAGVIINFNKFAETQFGYSSDEVIGKMVEMLIPQNLHGVHVGHRKGFYVHPEPRRMGEGRELYALKKDGFQFPVEVSLSYYTIDEETFVIAFVVDITVRKQSETVAILKNEELSVASEALVSEKELSELKSRFVTTASHEFRTPLSTILSSAYLLGKYKPEEYEQNKDRHIQRIKKAVEGMQGNLEDFISLGKLEEGMVQVKIEEFDSTLCVNEIQALFGEMKHLFKAGQRVHFEHRLDRPTFQVDFHLLRAVLVNLLSNAIKFSGENMVIEVNLKLTNDAFHLSVTDSGIGISVEDQHHLFERFFRAKNAVNIQGSGLGLHIISKYMNLLHGTLHIKSTLDEGSCFTLKIPQPVL